MDLIEASEKIQNNDLVAATLQMLPTILATQIGIEKISGKRADKYLLKFYKLSDLNEACKKYCIRIFFHISKSRMEGAFDLILKTAETYATDNN